MRITYLAHSGFMVQTDKAVLVFDYFRDPAHAVVKTLEKNPELPVVFFVSHHHPDHYNEEIFNLGQNHKRVYVLSNDVEARDTNSKLAIQGMSAGDVVENLPGISEVRAFRSTDEGVAFAVTLDGGKKVFHAGDLNLWHWNRESTAREVAVATAAFHKVLNRISEETPELDVVFFPVDVRQGEDAALGASEFLEEVRVANFFPMHFDGDYTKACDFASYPIRGKVDTQFHCLHTPGESIEL